MPIRSGVFAQMTAERPYTSPWDAPFPLKIAPSHEGYRPPSTTWFPGPTQVLSTSDISIGSAVFAGFTKVTESKTDGPQTDHSTQLVTIDCIYVRSTGNAV